MSGVTRVPHCDVTTPCVVVDKQAINDGSCLSGPTRTVYISLLLDRRLDNGAGFRRKRNPQTHANTAHRDQPLASSGSAVCNTSPALSKLTTLVLSVDVRQCSTRLY